MGHSASCGLSMEVSMTILDIEKDPVAWAKRWLQQRLGGRKPTTPERLTELLQELGQELQLDACAEVLPLVTALRQRYLEEHNRFMVPPDRPVYVQRTENPIEIPGVPGGE